MLLSESGELGPDRPTSRSLEKRLGAFGRAALRAVGGARRRRPARRARVRRTRPNGIVTLRNVLPDWSVRLRRRLAAAAGAAGRARRVLPRPPPPRADRAVGRRGSPSPPCRCRSPGCGCARSAPPGVIDAPDGPVPARAVPLGDERDRRDRLGADRRGALAWFGARALRRARSARAPSAEARARATAAAGAARPGVDGLAVATGGRGCARSWRSRGCATPTPPVCWSPPRTCGCSPPAAGAGWTAVVAARWSACVVARARARALGLALDLGPLELAWGDGARGA